MAENKQAYTSFATMLDANSEWNRMNFAVRSILAGVATATLAQVRAVRADGDGFTVDVQPMVPQVDGAGNTVDHGTIHNLPVWRVQGGASALIVAPVVGDIGLIVFASRDISGVKRAKAPAPPGSARTFDWADGIYLGGVLGPTATQFIRMDESGVTITAPAGVTINADVTVSGSVTTGAGSTFDGIGFDDHKHTGVQTGGGTSGGPTN